MNENILCFFKDLAERQYFEFGLSQGLGREEIFELIDFYKECLESDIGIYKIGADYSEEFGPIAVISIGKLSHKKKTYKVPTSFLDISSDCPLNSGDLSPEYSKSKTNIKENVYNFINIHGKTSLVFILGIFSLISIFYDNVEKNFASNLHANPLDAKVQTVTIKTNFEILTEKKNQNNALISKELEVQKKLRDQKRELNEKINGSKEVVELRTQENRDIEIELIRLSNN